MLRYLALAGAACLLWVPPDKLSAFITSPKLASLLAEHSGLIRTLLKASLAVGVPLEINAALSRWANNRWLLKADTVAWRWPDEIAVVTGGSRGIGAVVVQQLMALGVKIAVLDVVPLCDELKPGKLNEQCCAARSTD